MLISCQRDGKFLNPINNLLFTFIHSLFFLFTKISIILKGRLKPFAPPSSPPSITPLSRGESGQKHILDMNSTLEEDAAADNLTSFLDNDISNHIIYQINSFIFFADP